MTGRPQVAPTVLYDKQLDKPEFEGKWNPVIALVLGVIVCFTKIAGLNLWNSLYYSKYNDFSLSKIGTL